ncbi:coronin, putative [Trypanosoma brucei brucei TREU927]|uniref:Coronin n=1 Tax=Trypanosoma brucei brucei (strain 927/4 GUTat10.1) TaxID=185431 RepID=Q57W63_TRYB2|nr:coronin, putative [Trypanosoma brucei brucei TREU927]AAX70156.1 coronin, putative [Trypanosoma brucei]AAZ13075.1 coronin, putative [Trypanosoma brucei brucei TREU927]
MVRIKSRAHVSNSTQASSPLRSTPMDVSRFRHTQAVPARQDQQFLNLTPSAARWECSNLIACNDRFIAIPWLQLGSTAVLRHTDCGKLASNPPILLGQEGDIIDVAFNPFDSSKLFTASEDGTIMGWNIPEEGLTQNCSDNIVHLQGHSKKVGLLSFHPSAANVLASAGADMVVNVWDVQKGVAKEVVKCHAEQISSLDWNLDGSLLCTTSKDKKLNIVDPRSQKIVCSSGASESTKTQRALWARRADLVITIGVNTMQMRQAMVWDIRKLAAPASTVDVDQSCAVSMPFFDEDTSLFYIGSRGEGGIRSFELRNSRLINCSSYSSSEIHRGLCMVPKWMLDTHKCEIARFYALTQKSMYNVQMLLPRKTADEELQTDVYPPTFANEPAITADEYFSGVNKEPLVMSMQAVFDGKSLEATKAAETKRRGVPRPSEVESDDDDSSADEAVTSSRQKHADPNAVRGPAHSEGISSQTSSQLLALASLLGQQQAEVQRCREDLQKKESLVMETIAKIKALASGSQA